MGHEVGHTFGLQHSAVSSDLMFPSSVRARSWDLQPGEILTMNLMLERPGGNRYPDNDREVSSAARGRETVTYLCP